MQKICECCGGGFVAQRKNARFCSPKCRIKNHRPSWHDIVLVLQKKIKRMQELIEDDTWLIDELAKCAAEPDETKRVIRLAQLLYESPKPLRKIEEIAEIGAGRIRGGFA